MYWLFYWLIYLLVNKVFQMRHFSIFCRQNQVESMAKKYSLQNKFEERFSGNKNTKNCRKTSLLNGQLISKDNTVKIKKKNSRNYIFHKMIEDSGDKINKLVNHCIW